MPTLQMMKTPGYPASLMGDALRLEVERQLLADLEHHRSGFLVNGVAFDWADPCQEGHRTELLGGVLESMSSVAVRNASGAIVAEGWVDFIHGGGQLPLIVFWQYLDVCDDEGQRRSVANSPDIPEHVWHRLSDASREACAVEV